MAATSHRIARPPGPAPRGAAGRRAAAVIAAAVAKGAQRARALEGASDELRAAAAQCLDWAPARRRVRAAFAPVLPTLDHCLFKNYETNSKGVEIFWKSWLPREGTATKAALFFCHGYGDTCTFFFEGMKEVRELPHFLLGQSMGGAVALKAEYNAISYSDQMRLRTAVELLKATKDIESQLEKILM
nr:unnamed protein product [Digitaria exilis]